MMPMSCEFKWRTNGELKGCDGNHDNSLHHADRDSFSIVDWSYVQPMLAYHKSLKAKIKSP